MKYYTIGCPDYRWTYHYNYPPLFSDLLRYMPTENKEMILPNDNQPVSESQKGELCISGGQVTEGYLTNSEKNKFYIFLRLLKF
jgi:acyl-CoA synthetase (AMP-forming)/AMP-acid ligase II